MKLSDERLRFYLRHRDQLEEWFELRSGVTEAIDGWLCALLQDFEALAESLGPDVKLVDLRGDSRWPGLFLKHDLWPGNTYFDAQALIGLEWDKTKTTLGPSTSPYVGIRSPRANAIGRFLREDSEFQDRRRGLKDGLVTQWWPACSYIVPKDDFPERAEEYRQSLLDSVHERWKAYAPAVDRAVKA